MKKIIIVAAVVLAAAAGTLYYYVLMPKPEPPPLTFSPGDYFVTNIKESNRLLKATVVLVIDKTAGKKSSAYLEQHVSEIRDVIIFILRELSEEEIRSSGVEDKVRESIRLTLNERLETEVIKDVLFSDFVMQ